MQTKFLKELSPAELDWLPYIFAFWAMPHQLPPEGDWRTWVILGGRGIFAITAVTEQDTAGRYLLCQAVEEVAV